VQADAENVSLVSEIDQWFFGHYLPTWESIGSSVSRNPKEILDYWNVPMHAASMEMSRWLLTENDVLGLLSAIHKPLQSSGYAHTIVVDRRTVVYNHDAASVDDIWSRCRRDNTEIERLAVHFLINRTDNNWRVIGLASTPTAKSSLKDVWRES
jgi:hypothetical protein